MDLKEYLVIKGEICRSAASDAECPLIANTKYQSCHELEWCSPEEAIAIAEAWKKAHCKEN